MATRKVIPVKQLTSWSFSRYSDYTKCPAKCKYKHVDRIKEPANEAMERGSAIHTLAEQYIKGEIAKLPPELSAFKSDFADLKKRYKSRKLPILVEDNWAFTRDWDETMWNDWTGCWVRIKLDCAHYTAPDEIMVTDWKTGKLNDYKLAEYAEQLELYALAALLMSAAEDPKVRCRLGFLDANAFYPEPGTEQVWTRADIPKLQKLWEKRVKPMMADTKFPPKPSAECRWCYFSAAKNGPCKF